MIGKVWVTGRGKDGDNPGGTLVLTIPKQAAIMYGISANDLIRIEIKEVKKAIKEEST